MERYSDIEEDFPRLRSGNYTPTSKPDPAYNSVAWAVGDLNNFWDDVGVVGYYWPAGVNSEKVAIYVSDEGLP
jgi:hypothetical protein